MLTESRSLESGLRAQTREILLAQENSRLKTSLHLQDEIAQTLLAINIKLLAMKAAAKANARHFANEIANTQRLVRDSAKKVKRVHA
jgi:signal transduction histidine kinase